MASSQPKPPRETVPKRGKRGSAPPPPNDTSSHRTLGVTECAEALSISANLLRDYVRRGAPHTKGAPGKTNLFCAEEVVAWMQGENLDGTVGRPKEEGSAKLEDARLAKERAMARNWDLRNAQLEKLLIPIEVAKAWINRHITTARNQFLGLGANLTPLLEGREAAERQTLIDNRVHEILNELAAAVDQMADAESLPPG